MTRRKLLRLVDVAEILGVTKQRAGPLHRQEDFPAPVDRWARAIFGLRRTFGHWARTYGAERRGGVPGKKSWRRPPREVVRLRTPRGGV